MFKYKQYSVILDHILNENIYIELSEKIGSKINIYYNTIDEKFLSNEIKVIKKLEELYNIILLSFNKEKNIELEIVENLMDGKLILNYNIIIIMENIISFNIKFSITLNKIVKHHEIFKKEFNDIDNTESIDKITELDYKLNILTPKYEKIKNEPYYYMMPQNMHEKLKFFYRAPIKIYKKNKHFYISQNIKYIRHIKDKFTNIIFNNPYYDKYNANFHGYEVLILNIKNVYIKYNIKHLILNDIVLDKRNNFNNIHINKYEININVKKHIYIIQKKHGRAPNIKIYHLNNITNIYNYLILNVNIDYLILNQDMNNFKSLNANINFKINKGIILNNCPISSKDIDLVEYCKINKLDLIIN